MDKKYTYFGIICLVAALVLSVVTMQQQKSVEQYRLAHPELYPPTGTDATTGTQTADTGTQGSAIAPAATDSASPAHAAPAAPVVPTTPAATYVLSNDDIAVTLTEDGGAIKSVTLKKFLAVQGGTDPVVFNDGAPYPALFLSVPALPKPQELPINYWTWPGKAVQATGKPHMPPAPMLGRLTFDKTASTPLIAVFRGSTADGLDITRTYTLNAADSYLIEHTTTISNHSSDSLSLTRVFVNAGTPQPTPEAGAIAAMSLNFGYYDGSSANFITPTEFADQPARFLGIMPARPKRDWIYNDDTGPGNIEWVSVKDQFFAAALVPKDILGKGFYVEGATVPVNGQPQPTLNGDLELDLGTIKPGEDKKFTLDYYVGPKNYIRLDHLGQREDLIMQFGMFGPFSKILLLMLLALHSAVVYVSPLWGWGWAIILFTFFIKLLTWPLTAIQVRSGKRMAKLSAPMKALKEKYKDNPQKYQTEVMELYKKHKINPAAGCFPLLIQMPILFAFYAMLRTSSELRFASFLWIHDLSLPDTVAHIGGIPINILPVLMAVSQLIQMRLMPAPNMDETQRRIMQFMPLMMMGIFYTLPSGLVLYYTCSNILTSLQQVLTRRQPDNDPADSKPTPGNRLPSNKR